MVLLSLNIEKRTYLSPIILENLLRARVYNIIKIVFLKNTMVNIGNLYELIIVLKLIYILYCPMSWLS